MALKKRLPPYVRTSDTSRDAAISMIDQAASMRMKVLAWLMEHGPATDEAMARGLGMNPSTQRPRRVELAKDGLIRRVGTGKTTSGRSASLWGVQQADRVGVRRLRRK